MNNLITLCAIAIVIALNSVDKIFDYFEEEETFTDKVRFTVLGKKKEKLFTDDLRNKVKTYGNIIFQIGMLGIKFLV